MKKKSIESKDLKYLDAILKNDGLLLEEMYEEFLPLIESMVIGNNGSREDAKDVLQDGLIVVFEKASADNFELTSSLNTYIYGICRFIWLRKLKKKDNQTITLDGFSGLTNDENIEEALFQEEKWALFNNHFETLGQDCQKVLRMFFGGVKMKEIAIKMGYTSQFVKTKKFLCKKKLIERIKGDKKFKELL